MQFPRWIIDGPGCPRLSLRHGLRRRGGLDLFACHLIAAALLARRPCAPLPLYLVRLLACAANLVPSNCGALRAATSRQMHREIARKRTVPSSVACRHWSSGICIYAHTRNTYSKHIGSIGAGGAHAHERAFTHAQAHTERTPLRRSPYLQGAPSRPEESLQQARLEACRQGGIFVVSPAWRSGFQVVVYAYLGAADSAAHTPDRCIK